MKKIRLTKKEAKEAIKIGENNAILIFGKYKYHSTKFLNNIIENSKECLMMDFKLSIKQSLNFYIKNCKKMTLEDAIKFEMERRIEDISKLRYLINLCEIEIKKRVYIS